MQRHLVCSIHFKCHTFTHAYVECVKVLYSDAKIILQVFAVYWCFIVIIPLRVYAVNCLYFISIVTFFHFFQFLSWVYGRLCIHSYLFVGWLTNHHINSKEGWWSDFTQYFGIKKPKSEEILVDGNLSSYSFGVWDVACWTNVFLRILNSKFNKYHIVIVMRMYWTFAQVSVVTFFIKSRTHINEDINCRTVSYFCRIIFRFPERIECVWLL